MPTITKLKQQKRDKNRVNVYLDGKYSFSIDLENMVKLGLKVEKEYSQKEIAEFVKKGEFSKTLNNLIRFASLRPRSKKEISDWFYRRKVHESIHEELINRLNNLDMLDDEKFASWWVEQRNTFRPRSKRQLYSELLKKGIDKKLINNAINETDIDEVKIASELLDKNKRKWERLEDFERNKKASAYLARKGFNWSTISKALDSVFD